MYNENMRQTCSQVPRAVVVKGRENLTVDEVSSIHWNDRPYLLNFCQEPFGATMKYTLSFNIFIYKMYHIDDALYKV